MLNITELYQHVTRFDPLDRETFNDLYCTAIRQLLSVRIGSHKLLPSEIFTPEEDLTGETIESLFLFATNESLLQRKVREEYMYVLMPLIQYYMKVGGLAQRYDEDGEDMAEFDLELVNNRLEYQWREIYMKMHKEET